jgi:tRNA-binding EMAP/Myf-like protein
MYMAEKHRHPWVEKLDLSRIDFGRGKRRIVSGGELDTKYQITVPRERREGTV